MATATILCTQTSFGVGGYGSSDETTVPVGKADGYTKNARVRFPALNPAWVIKSIKFQFRRNDGYATRVLRFGTNPSASFDSRNTLDWKKNFSVSDGYAFKTFDFTPYKSIIQGYGGNWYVHITHGSGDRSYCTFNGGSSSYRPRIVVEYEDASVVLPDDTFTIGEESTFTVGVADSGLTHKLYYSAGSASGQIVVDEVDEFDGGAEVAWTPPVGLAYEVTDTDVGTITITVETYEGTTLRSSVPFEFNLAVPADMVPAIDDATISLVNPSGDTVGEYVQGRSRAQATIEARSVYGAEVISYQMEINGVAYTSETSEVLSGILNTPGTKTITLTVTDTRGRTATETLTNAITVYPYTPPVVASLKLERALNDPPDYTPSNSGQYIKFTLGCVFSPINGKNSKTGSIRFRASDGEWSEAFSLNDGMDAWGSTYSFPLQGLLGDNDIGSGSYVVEVALTDRYNTVTQEAELSSRLIWIDRHGSGEGVAIGGEAAVPSVFDVYLPSRFRGSVVFNGAPTYTAPSAAIANLFPYCRLSNPTGDTISYNADNRRAWVLNFNTITRCDSSWVDITTTALSAALQAAGTAQATADGKIRIFAQTTEPGGMTANDVGDLWVDTDDNNKLYRWNGTQWVQDDLIAEHSSAISSITTLDGKTTVFYQPNTPTANVTGDIWYDTDAVPVKIYRNGLYKILLGGSDATRKMGWVILMDGIYRVILAFRASTTNISDGHMGIARLPSTWTPPSANYMLRDTMLSEQIEGTSQYVSRLTTATGNLSGNMTYDFPANAGDKIWPWLCMLDANKTLLSAETWASIQKIG